MEQAFNNLKALLTSHEIGNNSFQTSCNALRKHIPKDARPKYLCPGLYNSTIQSCMSAADVEMLFGKSYDFVVVNNDWIVATFCHQISKPACSECDKIRRNICRTASFKDIQSANENEIEGTRANSVINSLASLTRRMLVSECTGVKPVNDDKLLERFDSQLTYYYDEANTVFRSKNCCVAELENDTSTVTTCKSCSMLNSTLNKARYRIKLQNEKMQSFQLRAAWDPWIKSIRSFYV